jgi:beta-glucanase (GH16 family)
VSPSYQRGGTLFEPVTFAVVALSIAALAGLGSYWATSGHTAAPAHTPAAITPSPSPATSPSPTTTTSTTTPPVLPPPGSHLTFNATFTGSSLDTATWATCYWYVSAGSGCTHLGLYPEQEWYLPSQDQVSDGVLHLVASPQSVTGTTADGQPKVFPCRSGMITTDPSYEFTYGYVQVVAQLPNSANTWPALWMLPADNAQVLPEIDLIELVGTQATRALVTFHPTVGPQQNLQVKTADLASGWHTFGLDWEPGSLTWYIDGRAVFSVTANVPTQPMYLLADLAITNEFHPLVLPGSCTGSLSIRSVQVWQTASQ